MCLSLSPGQVKAHPGQGSEETEKTHHIQQDEGTSLGPQGQTRRRAWNNFRRRNCRMPREPSGGFSSWPRAGGGTTIRPHACPRTVMGSLPVHNQAPKLLCCPTPTGEDWTCPKLGWVKPGRLAWAGPAAVLGPLRAADKSGNLKCLQMQNGSWKPQCGIWTKFPASLTPVS